MKQSAFRLPCSTPGLCALGLAGILALLATNPASALEFECNAPGDKRYIQIDMPGDEHLCEVSVEYPDGRRKVLWYADHDTLFCSAKAYELRDKYSDQWNFNCTTWPDRDGIDELPARNRYILDNQLKNLIARLRREASVSDSASGNTAQDVGERVVTLKTVASESSDEQPVTAAVQYFIGPDNGSGDITRDMTQVIVDSGTSWRVIARIDSLASQIDTAGEERVDSAIISGVSDAGILKVNTATYARYGNTSTPPICQGEQYLKLVDGKPEPQGSHRMVCDQPAN